MYTEKVVGHSEEGNDPSYYFHGVFSPFLFEVFSMANSLAITGKMKMQLLF